MRTTGCLRRRQVLARGFCEVNQARQALLTRRPGCFSCKMNELRPIIHQVDKMEDVHFLRQRCVIWTNFNSPQKGGIKPQFVASCIAFRLFLVASIVVANTAVWEEGGEYAPSARCSAYTSSSSRCTAHLHWRCGLSSCSPRYCIEQVRIVTPWFSV